MALCSIAMAAGIVGVVALVKGLVWRGRFGRGRRCGGPFGFRRNGGHRGGIGGSLWLRALYSRLDTTPGQEREIRAALEELRERAQDAKSRLPETRENIGRAVAGDEFDDSAFEVVSARVDATAEKMKDAFASALKRIHGVLDPKQRQRLAELIGKGLGPWGRGGFRGFGGPYREGAGR